MPPLAADELAYVAVSLGARRVPGWSDAELALAGRAARVTSRLIESFKSRIAAGDDPLGEAFCGLRPAAERRTLGATYTPAALVQSMLEWSAQRPPERVVDPGAGSGRFVVAAGRRFTSAELVAVEVDPLAALTLRAHLAAAGLAERCRVEAVDYRALQLPRVAGATLFLGNPPYVRHHAIADAWKQWLVQRTNELGWRASRLSGLHVHFFLATLLHAREGDRGALVTAAEWLDVNYGSLVRRLFLERLGGTSLHLLAPASRVFVDADTTAVIACFELGASPPRIGVRQVASMADLGALEAPRKVERERLATATRWSALVAGERPPLVRREGFVELGELCRVHRGQVTGQNQFWVANAGTRLPAALSFPSVTRARELFAAGDALLDASALRRVVDLPAELDELDAETRAAVERFLRAGRRLGADTGFIARHRRPWWRVGLREPAPILTTYMARRAPAIVRNLAGARHINIAHGLYPREALPAPLLDALARYLREQIDPAQGRTYAGGLTKFEPKELERVLVPAPALLAELAA